jgi:hypothetical protein
MSNTTHSWFESAPVRIRDDGAEHRADDAVREELMRIQQAASDGAKEFINRGMEAATEAKPPWPKGVYVWIRDNLKGQDYELMSEAQIDLAMADGSTTGKVKLRQGAIAAAAAAITTFEEPTDDKGTPTLNGGRGVWTLNGERVTFDGKTLDQRVSLVAQLPPDIYNFIAAEVNRLNRNPLGLQQPGKNSKTDS